MLHAGDAAGYGRATIIEAVTLTELAEAKRRLREDFLFVGILEKWDLSICLLHKMFGGRCNPREFENNRPGEGHKEHGNWSSASLHGYVDKVDGEIYELANTMFE